MADVEVARMVVTKVLTEDGTDIRLSLETEPDDLAFIDGCGMLTMALHLWMNSPDDDEDEDDDE